MSDPILVAGAGPTGLMAALELSRQGVPVRLVDRREAPATTSRAAGIQARTLELMAQRGLADELVRLGNPARWASSYSGGQRVFRLDFSRVDSEFNYLLFLPQTETERILRDALARQGMAVEWGTALVGVAQQAHGGSPVTATLQGPRGLELARAPWLISAEGAHSLVRGTLGIEFEGKSLDTQYALGDLQVDGDLPGTDLHIFSSEQGFMGLFPLGGGHFRLMASHPAIDPERGPPTLDELQRLYDERSTIPARFHDLGWSSWFRINSRMVPRLKIGRLVLGGDAAHIHSPAGGQGMNTGLQDMVNLCWKLALFQRGQAEEALVETYEHERLAVMRDVLFKTEGLTQVVGSENAVVRSLFERLGPWIVGSDLVQAHATRRMAQVSIDYRGGPLAFNHAHVGSLKAGDRVPPHRRVRCRDGQEWPERTLSSLLAPDGFVLLVAHGSPGEGVDAAVTQALQRASIDVPVFELAPPEDAAQAEACRQTLGAASSCFLVRPDGYVAVATGARAAASTLAGFFDRWLKR